MEAGQRLNLAQQQQQEGGRGRGEDGVLKEIGSYRHDTNGF